MNQIIKHAVESLLNQENVCLPTETVYGLAGLSTSDIAVQNIFKLKKRSPNKPLSLLCGSVDQVFQCIRSSKDAEKLAEKFWPGPLTIIGIPTNKLNLSKIGTGNTSTLGIRIPKCQVTIDIISQLPAPVFAPSANISNFISPTTASYIKQSFGPDLLIVEDDNAISVGIESTILDLSTFPKILRLGAISKEAIEDVIGRYVATIENNNDTKPQYTPKTPIAINMEINEIQKSDAVLAFGDVQQVECTVFRNLSVTADLAEATTNFYKMLNEVDNYNCTRICVTKIPEIGLGIVINDRLKKAILRK